MVKLTPLPAEHSKRGLVIAINGWAAARHWTRHWLAAAKRQPSLRAQYLGYAREAAADARSWWKMIQRDLTALH